MRVIAFTKYDREAASTRQRFLQYGPVLEEAGITLEYRPLLDDRYVRSLATGERWSRSAIAKSYLSRFAEVLRKPAADVLWVHGELFPYLPSFFDRLVFRADVPLVYDCDDAFFLNYNIGGSRLRQKVLAGKIERLIGGAAAATCGNEFLRDYVGQYCPSSIVLPTVVDIDLYRPEPQPKSAITIGWIGSPSTWHNVKPLLPVIKAVCESTGARFRVVGAGEKAHCDCFPDMELVPWSEPTERSEVQAFDIGIMPLVDAPFERGKSGYKLVQYMGCGVPAVASPVGANNTVLDPQCGLFADSPAQWDAALRRLIGDSELRQRMGEAGRARAVDHYSLQVHAPRLIDLFRKVREARGAAAA